MKYKSLKTILLVVWIDAASFSEWQGDDDAEKKCADKEICTSIGWFLKKTERHLCLVGTVSEDKDNRINELQKIPFGCITSIKIIKEN
jgi:hypothetical protein